MSTAEAPELWDTSEIARYMRKQRSTVQRHTINMPGFPEPIRGSGRPKLYVKADVIRFLLNQDVGQYRRR